MDRKPLSEPCPDCLIKPWALLKSERNSFGQPQAYYRLSVAILGRAESFSQQCGIRIGPLQALERVCETKWLMLVTRPRGDHTVPWGDDARIAS